MADYEDKTRISKVSFEISAVFLYTFATLAASIRFLIRIRLQKLCWVDDGFLLSAFVLVTACFGLLFKFIDDMYTSWAFANDFNRTQITYSEIVALAERLHRYTTAFIVLAWTGIVAVKFSFLFFFKGLIRRIRYLELFWGCTVIFTACSWLAGAIAEIFTCPRFDERVCTISCLPSASPHEPFLTIYIVKCGSGKYHQGTIAITGFITTANIVSDIISKSLLRLHRNGIYEQLMRGERSNNHSHPRSSRDPNPTTQENLPRMLLLLV